jgi:hypothetical protein
VGAVRTANARIVLLALSFDDARDVRSPQAGDAGLLVDRQFTALSASSPRG